MSAVLRLSTISPQYRSKIREDLCLQPNETFFNKSNRYSTSKDPILFYQVDERQDKLILPYMYANILAQQNINSMLEKPVKEYNFIGGLRDKQIKPMEEASQQLLGTGTTILGLPPGFGKTVCSAYLSSLCKGVTLVFYTRESLQKQWLKTFTDFTDADVWIVGSSHIYNQTVDKRSTTLKIESYDKYVPDIILCMKQSVHKIPPPMLNMITTLVIDEAHQFCTQDSVIPLLATTPKYVIACSATLDTRSDGMQSMIHHMCGEDNIVKRFETKQFTVYKFETGVKVPIPKNARGKTDWSGLVKALTTHPQRNAYIVELVEKNPNHKIIILTWTKHHVEVLKTVLEDRGNDVDFYYGNRKSYSDSRILIGTVSKIGTGFDEANACPDYKGTPSNMLIICGSTKNVGTLEQNVGRVFRAEEPVIFHLVDDMVIIKKHWRICLKWYSDPVRNGNILTVGMSPEAEKDKYNETFVGESDVDRIKQLYGTR